MQPEDSNAITKYPDGQISVRGNVEVESIDQSSYWERVDDIGDGGAGFARTEIPDTQVLPHPGGRSAEILKHKLIQERDIVQQLQHSSLFELSQSPASTHDHGHVTLRTGFSVAGETQESVACCSRTPEQAFETIVNRFFEEGKILKFYIAVDRSLQEVAHMSPSDVGADFIDPVWKPQTDRSDMAPTKGADRTPTDRELMEALAESQFHDPSDIRSFSESNYDRERSETNDNSPPDEQIVDIEYDASEIDDESADFETKMYKVANQTEDEDHIGEVVEYRPDMDAESVEIVVRCPDQSIGLLEYEFPETESANNSAFVAMINCARETKLVADDDGNVEQTYAEITLDSIERLKNAEIPLKEHKDSWVVATSNELETDGSDNDSTEANGSADPRKQVADMLSQRFKGWVSSTALGLGRAMFWVTTIAGHITIFTLLQLLDESHTVSEYYNTVTDQPASTKAAYIVLSATQYYLLLTPFL